MAELSSEEEIEKIKKKWPQAAALLALLGGGPVYVMSEYFYTRREAQIELQHIREDAQKIAETQHDMKTELLRAAEKMNEKLDRLNTKMTIYLRAHDSIKKQRKYSDLETNDDKEGG